MSNIASAKSKLISIIGDEDTCVGFLLGGIGEINKNRQTNFFVVNKNTAVSDLEEVFKSFTNREDMAIVLINQNNADQIRHLIDKYDKIIPVVLEIPSKDSPYDPNKDSILKRAKVDSIKYSCLPLVKKFLNLDSELNDLDINVLRRCFPQNPKNSNENFMTESRGYDGTTRGYKTGEIVFTCPIYNANKALYKPVDLITPTSKNVMEGDEYQEQAIGDLRDDYKIVKIRGIAYTLKVSPAIANRMVNQCQLILKSVGFTNNFIRLDNCKKSQCGLNPGFGLCLFAQTANGCMYFGEACSFKSDEEYVSNTNLRPSPLKTPEDIATQATFKLLDEIYMGGSIDSTNQTLAFHLMALASNNISRILTGKITTYALKNMKLIEEILKVKFKIDKTDLIDKKLNRFEGGDENDIENTNLCPNKYIVTCLGSGFVNINKTYK